MRFNFFPLRSPDASDASGENTAPDATPAPQPAPTTTAAATPQAPPPPAAAIVAEGRKTEADVAAELDAKKLQARISQLEDENRTLKTVLSTPPQSQVAQAQKKSWLEGGSFFD